MSEEPLGPWGGDPDSIMYHGRDEDFVGMTPRAAPVERNWTGPYCHRCGAKVDHRATGEPMDPYHTYDRDTDNRHYWRCYDRKRS